MTKRIVIVGSGITGITAIKAIREIVYGNITPVTTLNAFGISLFSMGCIDETKSTNILVDKDIDLKEYKK